MRHFGFLLVLLFLIVACDNSPTSTPDFSITLSGDLSINQTGEASTTVSIARKNGFSGAIQLVLENADGSALNSGLHPTFSNPTTTSTLTLAADATVPVQLYNLRVRAVGGGLTKTATLNLTVNPAPSFDLSLSTSSLNVTKGSSATLNVSVSPNATFSGDIALSLERSDGTALPDGLSATFSPLASGNSILTVAAAAPTVAGSYNLQVKATGGGTTKTAALTVQVGNAPSFNLSLSQSALSITKGNSGSVTVNLERLNGFVGAVALTLENQDGSALASGITPTFTPASATGNSSSLSVAVSSAAVAGVYNLRVRGVSGALSSTASLTLTVVASTVQVEATTRTLNIDSNSANFGRGDPANVLFFAYQEGTGAWKTISGTNGVYRFNIGGDGKYGILAVCFDGIDSVGNSRVETILLYLTTAEATSVTLCARPKLTNAAFSGVKGNILGLNATNPTASVNTWNTPANPADPTAPQPFDVGAFQGPFELLGVRFPANSGNPKMASKALFFRDILLNSASYTQDVDFGSASTFDLEAPNTATITGAAAPFSARVDFVGAKGGRVMVAGGFGISSNTFNYRTIPAPKRITGDYHVIQASVSDRYVVRTLEGGANITLNIPPTIGASITVNGSQLALSWSGTTPDLQWTKMRQDLPQKVIYWRLAVSKGWAGATKTLTVPSFSGQSGWQSKWALDLSQALSWWHSAITTDKPIGEVFPDAEAILVGGSGIANLTKPNQTYGVAQQSGLIP